jgi:transposase-like protein
MKDCDLDEERDWIAQHLGAHGHQLSPELRQRIARYMDRRREAGAWWSEIAQELGVSRKSLYRWTRPKSDPAEPTALVRVEIEPTPAGKTVTIVAPSGFRIEGVSLVEALAALRGLE